MNWSSDGTHAIPQNGDTISFANITTGISITNDIPNLRLASIVDNLNYGVWINGKLEAGAVNSPGSAFLIAAGASGDLTNDVSKNTRREKRQTADQLSRLVGSCAFKTFVV